MHQSRRGGTLIWVSCSTCGHRASYPGAGLLTPLIFNLLCHFPVPLCTTCMLVATQTSSEGESTVQERRWGGGKGRLATLSSRFIKTLLSLSKPSHHPHEAAPFQDLWQRQPLQCFQRVILNLPKTFVLIALTRIDLLISWDGRQKALTC